MSFGKTVKIGKPGQVKKNVFTGLMYEFSFARSSTVNTVGYNLATDIISNQYLFNVPAGTTYEIKINWRVYNVTANWSLATWNGSTQHAGPTSGDVQSQSWEFQESVDCNTRKINSIDKDYFSSGVVDIIKGTFVVSNKPSSFTNCENDFIRLYGIIKFKNISEDQVTIQDSNVPFDLEYVRRL